MGSFQIHLFDAYMKILKKKIYILEEEASHKLDFWRCRGYCDFSFNTQDNLFEQLKAKGMYLSGLFMHFYFIRKFVSCHRYLVWILIVQVWFYFSPKHDGKGNIASSPNCSLPLSGLLYSISAGICLIIIYCLKLNVFFFGYIITNF